MSSSICIPNMTFLACTVVEKSLSKKCYGITEGRTDGRMDGRTDGMTDKCKPVYPHFFKAGSFAIPRYNTSLSTCIPNMNTLTCSSTEIFDKKFHNSKYGKKENLDKYREE